MQLTQGSSCTGTNGNSLPFGAATVCVGVGLTGNIQNAASKSDPTRLLKFIGGSRTGAIDCGGGTGADALRDSIAHGCTDAVTLNDGTHGPCDDHLGPPRDCLSVDSGGKVGPTRQGMNERFHPGATCPANAWTTLPAATAPSFGVGDPRLVPLIITLPGAIAGSSVPVTDYGEFYVTGWDGAPSDCNGINEAPPPGAGNGTIWGHFVKYIGSFPTSIGGTGCDFSITTLAPCITVMTD